MSIGVLQVCTANSCTKTVILKPVLHACRDERKRFGKKITFVRIQQEKAKELVQQRSRGQCLPVEAAAIRHRSSQSLLEVPETGNKVEDESRRKALLYV